MKINPAALFCEVLRLTQKRYNLNPQKPASGLKRCWINWTKGFTLIELLIVIAILGVLAAGVLVAIDPVDKSNSANDSKVQSDIGVLASALEAYATTHGGYYPDELDDLTTSGDLKRVPVPPSGYGVSYSRWNMTGTPPEVSNTGCVDGASPSPTCTGITIAGQLKSKKYTTAFVDPIWKYQSPNGKSCATGSGSGCP